MNLSRAVKYYRNNERQRIKRANESIEESFERRSRRRNLIQSARHVCVSQSVDVQENDLGTMTEICEFCGAFYWKNERNTSKKYTKCCHDGKVHLPGLSSCPDLMKELLCSDSPESRNYRLHIREYNAALAFASMGAEINIPSGNGPYCFKIHGQIYHKVSPLYSKSKSEAGYGQLYIFDSSEANTMRMSRNASCNPEVMQNLDQLLRSINPFAQCYLQMHQILLNSSSKDVKMVFMENQGMDMRRYNAPTIKNEIAAIFVGDNGEPPSNRDICIYPVGDNCQRISPINKCSDPMVYPLLFPHGECGWNSNLEHVEERRCAKRVRVTQLQFYSYRFSVRNEFSILHNSGKLFQQYIVDVYVKTEGARLNYLRLNQKDLRVELYDGLLDALQSEATVNKTKIGKVIILPSSFQGSPRHMQQSYQDAMALVRKFGKPDLFVTFTCNPMWPEILNALANKQRSENRPDIVVRVFKMKLSELLDDILKKNIFGKVISHIYVIEFQKRGLPHAHILLTLDSCSKIRNKDDIDKFVCAELPNQSINPRLFEIVSKCLIHGPCGTINPNSPCMKDGQCSKNFPKALNEATEENVNGYPIYRRRAREPVKVRKHEVDNRWIVPYNPWLIKKFNAHINVEVCASVKSVKYLYKYVYKGHDAASVRLQSSDGLLNHDEILTFLDGRYVSAPEAMWRLSEFCLSEKSHVVMRLAVHLPNKQQVIFQSGQEVAAVSRSSTRLTTLTAWFQLNQHDVEAHNYNYADIPLYYVFDKTQTIWKKRQRGGHQIIGRMPVVNFLDSERYFLRMLLLRRPGALSFDDLKTVNGTVLNTFQQACTELGLLAGDRHWHETLTEASEIKMPSQLRSLFAIICAFGEVEDAYSLWEQFKEVLIEDFVQKFNPETGPQYALAEINQLLNYYGLNLKKINLPHANLPSLLNISKINAVDEENKAKVNLEKMNEEQKMVIQKVLGTVYENKSPKLFFLDGPAGTGKTFIYRTLIHIIRSKGDQVTSVASTGIAATLLEGGRTAHSIFKIPLVLDPMSTCNVKPNSSEARLLCETKLIIWDEAPMTHIHAFLAVDRLLQDILDCPEPFGGKAVLLGGDYRQVLPVVPRGSRSLTVACCLKKHPLWSHFHILYLTKNMRALASEKEFSKWLLEIGDGVNGDTVKLPPLCYPLEQNPVKQVYSDLDFKTITAEKLNGRAILTVTNDLSIELNNEVLNLIPGMAEVYESVDNVLSEDSQDHLLYPEEFLNSLTPTGMPPHKLKLKKGAVIMLLRNLMPSKGLCNGTRLTVIKLQRNIIEAEIIGSCSKETFLIPRIPLIPSDSNMPFRFKRKQFPVRLAFSMTINKSQGQTFDKVCLVLSKPVFTHGQLYVGLSRARCFNSITVVSPTNEVYNCVYKEVL